MTKIEYFTQTGPTKLWKDISMYIRSKTSRGETQPLNLAIMKAILIT